MRFRPSRKKSSSRCCARASRTFANIPGRATSGWCSICRQPPWVMIVRDDGRGFDVRRVAEDPRKVGSYGLVGMRERAELMGGTLEIVSQTLEGTVVTLIGPAERAE